MASAMERDLQAQQAFDERRIPVLDAGPAPVRQFDPDHLRFDPLARRREKHAVRSYFDVSCGLPVGRAAGTVPGTCLAPKTRRAPGCPGARALLDLLSGYGSVIDQVPTSFQALPPAKLTPLESLHLAAMAPGADGLRNRVVTPALSTLEHGPPSECRYSLVLGFGSSVTSERDAVLAES